MKIKKTFHTIDTHTCGEPTRNVLGGIAKIPGKTMIEKLEYMSTEGDWVRQLLTYEPRGNEVMQELSSQNLAERKQILGFFILKWAVGCRCADMTPLVLERH